jgi:hypothetical protein
MISEKPRPGTRPANSAETGLSAPRTNCLTLRDPVNRQSLSDKDGKEAFAATPG